MKIDRSALAFDAKDLLRRLAMQAVISGSVMIAFHGLSTYWNAVTVGSQPQSANGLASNEAPGSPSGIRVRFSSAPEAHASNGGPDARLAVPARLAMPVRARPYEPLAAPTAPRRQAAASRTPLFPQDVVLFYECLPECESRDPVLAGAAAPSGQGLPATVTTWLEPGGGEANAPAASAPAAEPVSLLHGGTAATLSTVRRVMSWVSSPQG